MFRKVLLWSALAVATLNYLVLQSARSQEVIDPAVAQTDPDFSIQGEYVGDETQNGKTAKVGAQVVAEGDGKFQVAVFSGGLPGDGWKRGDPQIKLGAKTEDKAVVVEGEGLSGKIADGKLTLADADGKRKLSLKRVERKSPTLDAKPPAGAKVLFDGSNTDAFDHGTVTDMKTLLSGVTSKEKFGDCKIHLEFRCSWMPKARGQGRSNSGVYLDDCYEIQVLDSFGLEGRNNECGGFYSIQEPLVNMCLPPLAWQTYDIDFTAPKYNDQGDKIANARVTVRQNGVVIHDDLELPRGTPGRQGEGPGPRPLHLQGHGNKVQYRNIWVVPK